MTQEQPDIIVDEQRWDESEGIHRFSTNAMATTFEILIPHHDREYARQASWAAFEELERLEMQLSRFVENSDISRLNSLPENQLLLVGLAAFECLELSEKMYVETRGAFDVTIGALVECLLSKDKAELRDYSKEELKQARMRTGSNLIRLDKQQYTVQLLREGVDIDLGGIGKGYGLDQMAELLQEWSIRSALLHGGCSTVLAVGAPPGREGWPVTISHPYDHTQTLARINLKNQALSGSGVQDGVHIIDPRRAAPVEGKVATWASAATAGQADALSTAFMVMSPDEVKQFCLDHPDVRAMIALKEKSKKEKRCRLESFGRWKPGELL